MSIKFPATIGACIDALYEARAKRLELTKQVEQMKEIENAYAEHILNTFDKSELKGAKGELATAGIKQTTVYQLSDWEAFINYVEANQAWELLRKQPGSTACKERFEAGVVIPGITPFVKIDLSLTKA
jgi:hypothetical protein